MLDLDAEINSPAAIEAADGHETASGLLETPERPFGSPCNLPAARAQENAESYPGIVAVLNGRWRVIDGKCGLQWILQRRDAAIVANWRGNA